MMVSVTAQECTGKAYGIREVSGMTSLSVDTLRWYEKQGLLPVVARTSSGQRRYTADAVRFVRLVQVLRRTGMSISAVREFVELRADREESHRHRAALLERQRSVLLDQIEQRNRDLELLDDKIEDLSGLIARGVDCEDVFATGGAQTGGIRACAGVPSSA